MKKIYLLLTLLLSVLFSFSQSNYSIEGRWTSEQFSNTMYEFNNGIRYTYYCNTIICDSNYWNSLTISNAIPNPNPYTYNNDSLIIDLHFGNSFDTQVAYECEGNIVNFSFNNWDLYRVGTIIANCSPNGIQAQNGSTKKELVKVVDLLGRESKISNNEVLLFIYSDGTVEKKVSLD